MKSETLWDPADDENRRTSALTVHKNDREKEMDSEK